MARSKYYVVWIGRKPGVYATWAECEAQVRQFPEAKYKAFPGKEEAEAAFRDGWEKHWGQAGGTQQAGQPEPVPQGAEAPAEPQAQENAPGASSGKQPFSGMTGAGSKPGNPSSGGRQEGIDYDSICVDAGTRGNPGPVEYKGVDTATGEVLFSVGPIGKGTNNLGEFLAIVHALAYLKKLGSSKTVYSDSRNAIKWVREKKVSTTLPRDESTREIWNLIDRAERWLRTNDYPNPVRKWNTEAWGENPADYGRK